MTQARAKAMQTAQKLSHAKKGLFFGVLSGATWGLDGVILGMALAMAPFTDGISLYAGAMAGACMHDGFAGFWIFLYNLFTGRWKEYGRTLRTRPGMIVCIGALFGGPIGMTGYLLGINMAGASYSLAITAMYPAIGAILAVFILKEKITPRVWMGIATCILGAIIVGGLTMFWGAFAQNAVWFMAAAGLAGGFSYVMWYRALNTTGVGRAMALNITYALWAIVFGYFLTDLQLTANLIGGACVITFGTILVVANPKELLNLRAN